jgi:hypothetical protein
MPDNIGVDLRTLGLGYLRAYHRLHDTSLRTASSDELFIPLHETLGWLYSLLLRGEVKPLVPDDVASALRFVRGRVHHRWADAVEFRNDVQLPPVWLGWQVGKHIYHTDPTVYSDWCWRPAADLPKGQARGEAVYVQLLEGQQVKSTLTPFTDLVYLATALETADVLAAC